MALSPKLQCDDSDDDGTAKPVHAGNQANLPDISELTTTLAAHGAGLASSELALDLVLHEIVEQALLATTALGAAIALMRDGEMVCRAASGTNVPGLGVALEVHSGLSGLCVQTGEAQICEDTENDSRVNFEATRELRVRSILVVPIIQKKAVLGVFEIFSARPQAFGNRDIQTLQALSRRIVENSDRAYAPIVKPDPVKEEAAPFETVHEDVTSLPNYRESTHVPEYGAAEAAIDIPVKPRRDYFTGILIALLIGMAVLLGWMVARVEWNKRLQSSQIPKTGAPVVPTETKSGSTAEQSSISASQSDKPTETPRNAPAPSRPNETVPPGGLAVYQGDKLVFRSTQESMERKNSAEIIPARGPQLLTRVDPIYPEQAKQDRAQGAVILSVLVDANGKVKEVHALSGNAELTGAAIDAVRQWQFRSYLKAGKAVEFETQITVDFKLPQD